VRRRSGGRAEPGGPGRAGGRPGLRQFAEVEAQHLPVTGNRGPRRLAARAGSGPLSVWAMGSRNWPISGRPRSRGLALAVEQDEAAAPVGKGSHGRFGVTAVPAVCRSWSSRRGGAGPAEEEWGVVGEWGYLFARLGAAITSWPETPIEEKP